MVKNSDLHLMITRPITPIEDFEKALIKANLSENDYELIEYIRYTGVFTQPSLTKELKRSSKPPILTKVCEICRKIGFFMPEHFQKVITWSENLSEHNTRWDGHLICAEGFNVDNIPLSPSSGTTLFDVLVVHKELFMGFD